MYVKEISVDIGGTVNTGNYENIKFTAGAVAALTEEDNAKEAFATLWDMAATEVTERIAEVKK